MRRKKLRELKYNGYVGQYSYNVEDDEYCGRLIGIKDLITFSGFTGIQVEANFVEAVKDYQELLKQLRELAGYLKLSTRKLSDFKNGKIFDFWLLIQYAAIIGKNIDFDMKD
ncbi:MAG: hypothetical protein R3243_14790 [Arenibacter latericius]|nr:hypothetical protein [Arenibacter latericius]